MANLGMEWTITLTKGYEIIQADEPIGFDALLFTLRRSDLYSGMEFLFTDTLIFTGYAGDFLMECYEMEGIDAKVNVKIKGIECNEIQFLYDGIINFNVYNRDDKGTSVGIKQSSFAETFKNRIETPVNIDSNIAIDGKVLQPDIVTFDMQLHSKEFFFQSYFKNNPILSANPFEITSEKKNDKQIVTPPLQLIYGDVEQTLEPYYYTGDQPFFYSGFTYPQGIIDRVITVNGRLKMGFKYRATNSGIGGDVRTKGTFRIQLLRRKVTTNEFVEIIDLFRDEPTTPSYDGSTYYEVDFTFTRTLTLLPDENIEYYVFWEGNIPRGDTLFNFYKLKYRFDNESFLYLSEASTYPASFAKVVFVHEALNRICESITGVIDCFRSDYLGKTDTQVHSYLLQGEGSLEVITNGLNIRKLLDKDGNLYPITASFKDIFEGLKAIHNLGMRIEREGEKEYIRVEPVEYFYKRNPVLTLTNVRNIKKSVALELINNEFEIGYAKWETESKNGIDEFNTKRNYSLPIVSQKQKLSVLSGLIASGYAIEFTRRIQFKVAPTTDNQTDNDLFIICAIKQGDTYISERGGFDPKLNLFSPDTAYNIRISPARMANRWLNVVAASTYRKLQPNAKFQSGTGNYQMQAAFIKEDEDKNLQINPLYIPDYYSFEYLLDFDIFLTLVNDPTLAIYFGCGEEADMSGYIKEAVYSLKDGMVNFKLLGSKWQS